jgi:hypothetical protein
MKKSLICAVVGLLMAFGAKAQNDISSPQVITGLPYSVTNQSTSGTLDDYGPTDACGSTAMENEDYVFSFTPATSMTVNIALSDTEIISEAPMAMGASIGLFVMDGDPVDTLTNCVAKNDTSTSDPAIQNLSLASGITYYIIVSSEDENLLIETYPTTVNFDIDINEVFTSDAGIMSIVPIEASCGMSGQSISCTIHNFGSSEITSTDLAFKVDDGSETVETYSGSILPGDEVNYTFTAQADFTGTGAHSLQVYTKLTSDGNAANDTSATSVLNLPVISSLPYTQGFETDDHYWSGSEGSSWETGIPNDTITINTAFEGSMIAATNTEGNTNTSEASVFTSPCFDFSGSGGISLAFVVWHQPGMLGATMGIETSVDGGLTWTSLDDSWSGSSGGWTEKTYNITSFAGEANCRIRFFYEGSLLAAEGLAVDNLKIEELPQHDVAPIALLGPGSSCGLGNSESVKVLIKNHGVTTETGFDISYSIDNGVSWTTESFSSSIAFDEEVSFSFSTPVDMTAIDTYEIIVATGLPGEENSGNDTISQTVIHSDVYSAFPYNEGFEAGNAGWTADGVNSSLELGEPAGSIINTAAEGSQAWVTNLTGSINDAETSYLTSPCFDFSSLINPAIDADIAYETQMMSSGFIMEYSLDYGITWDTIQAGGAASNWYGGLLSGSWNGSSGGWVSVHNTIPELAGQPVVMFRFAFDSGTFSLQDYEGIAIDNISISDCADVPVADFEYSYQGQGLVNFTNLSVNADSVEWNFDDNDYLPTTSNEENPSFEYSSSGTYNVTLTVFNDCGSDQVSYPVEIIITANDISSADALRIYPNPAEQHICIDGVSEGLLQVYSADGKCLVERRIVENHTLLPVENLSAGFYILKITNQEKSISKNIIIR